MASRAERLPAARISRARKRQGDFAALGRMLASAHRRPPRASAGRATTTSARRRRRTPGATTGHSSGSTRRCSRSSNGRAGSASISRRSIPLFPPGKPQTPTVAAARRPVERQRRVYEEGPVVFDPAVYYGDREADLAMTELFGGFPREFYGPTTKRSAGRGIREAQAPVQPLPPAQPPQPFRRWLPGAGEVGDLSLLGPSRPPSSSSCSSPDWYISRMMSEPPTNSPFT